MFLCKYFPCVSYFRAFGVLSLFVILFSGCSKQGLEAPKGGSEVRPSQMKLKRKIELYKIQKQPFQATMKPWDTLRLKGRLILLQVLAASLMMFYFVKANGWIAIHY